MSASSSTIGAHGLVNRLPQILRWPLALLGTALVPFALLAKPAPQVLTKPGPILSGPVMQAPVTSGRSDRLSNDVQEKLRKQAEEQQAQAAERRAQEQAARDQQKREEAIRDQTALEEAQTRCRANSGEWFAEIDGISLSAAGSDVDEIYGTIEVYGPANTRYLNNTRRAVHKAWLHRMIWASKENVNIGQETQRDLSTVLISSKSNIGEVQVHMFLTDEDDGRGGSNDDSFFLDGINSFQKNYRSFQFHVPDCHQPSFSREWRSVMVAYASSSRSNSVTLEVRVKVWR